MVSSPAATGGAGHNFEEHVNSYWLSLLLVGATPPVLLDCTVAEVSFQNERLGWSTDDFLVTGRRHSRDRKLLGQVKRKITISEKDEECVATITDFWKDFKNPDFRRSEDAFALVTLRGTDTLLEHFANLLACARASLDGEEFSRRVATQGVISKKAVTHLDELKRIVAKHEGHNIEAAEIWGFLTAIHVLPLDLATHTAQTEGLVKSLLMFSATGSDARQIAANTWNALVVEAGKASGLAQSFTRSSLPSSVTAAHGTVHENAKMMFDSMIAHSSPVIENISSLLGGEFHLERSAIVNSVLESLEYAQVVLLSGAAGSGKSGIAKAVMSNLGTDCFVFAFRAEEFACPHLDTSLLNAQINCSTRTLECILAGHPRKVLLVESAERLLEHSVRDAFNDLMKLVARDPTWKVVLTCRDYSVELVKTSFLDTALLKTRVVNTPLLDDTELDQIGSWKPALGRPLSNPALRKLMRNPYVLDKAIRIGWPAEGLLPSSEREFRDLFWKDIVRDDARLAQGLPSRRNGVFIEVALRRARALTPFVNCSDLDQLAVSALLADSLVTSSRQHNSFLAPNHDVLEDWAILRWLEEKQFSSDGDPKGLSSVVNSFPAIRRTYRKWVFELMAQDEIQAEAFVRSVVTTRDLPDHFRDDTIIAVLRSGGVTSFLRKYGTELLVNDRKLIDRAIFLLRVACVRTSDVVAAIGRFGSLSHVPEGAAWPAVLELLQKHLDLYGVEEIPMLLGLLEDWAKGIDLKHPYPEGASSAFSIADSLLAQTNSYKHATERKRILRILARIPMANPSRFKQLLLKINDDTRPCIAEEMQELLYDSSTGIAVARDLPELARETLQNYLLLPKTTKRTRNYSGNSDEDLFGTRHKPPLSTASAFNGPYLALLRFHFADSLTFLISICNHCSACYAARSQDCETFDLTLPNGCVKSQIADVNLWCMYRGTSSGPDSLKSLLMALEHELMDIAKSDPDWIDSLLLSILEKSDSVLLTAVAAGIAIAHTKQCIKSLTSILTSRTCIRLDRVRLARERHAVSKTLSLIPSLITGDPSLRSERTKADSLPHRSNDLENAALLAQFIGHADIVHPILDRHLATLPATADQSEDDRLWRLALHRMDSRSYRVSVETSTEIVGAHNAGGTLLRFDPTLPAEDLQPMVSDAQKHLEEMNATFDILVWGHSAFERDQNSTCDLERWRDYLSKAQSSAAVSRASSRFERGGPEFVAAVCVRDHWEELTEHERIWCAENVIKEVERSCNDWSYESRQQRFTMCPDRACAWVLPILIGKLRTPREREQARTAFIEAITHPTEEVRDFAARGAARNLWSADRDLAEQCVNGLAAEAMVNSEMDVEQREALYKDRIPITQLTAQAAISLRKQLIDGERPPSDAFQKLDISSYYGAEGSLLALAILQYVPDEPLARTGFKKLAEVLPKWWDESRSGHDNEERHPDYQTVNALLKLLEKHIHAAADIPIPDLLAPLAKAMCSHSREIGFFIRGLTILEDAQPSSVRFWTAWQYFADHLLSEAPKLKQNDPLDSVEEVVSALFLSDSWKTGVTEWPSLVGHEHRIRHLFDNLPSSPVVFGSYLRHLNTIGQQQLPAEFVRLNSLLRRSDPASLLSDSNTLLTLEMLLQRHVYATPHLLKSDRNLRLAVLELLDALIDQGSSAAFSMRDDFVTPLPAN